MLLSDLLILSLKPYVQHNKVVLMNRLPNVVNGLVFGVEGNTIKGSAGLQVVYYQVQQVEPDRRRSHVCGSGEVDGGVGVPPDRQL